MKNIVLFIIGIIVALGTLSFILYFFHSDKMSYILVMEIDKPNKYDKSQLFTYNYASNEKIFVYYLTDWYNCRFPSQQGYDITFAYNISKNLDFNNYDYIITFQKKILALKYSPFLEKKYDGIGNCEKKKPLIPIYDKKITDKVYIYRIQKNDIYRAPGP